MEKMDQHDLRNLRFLLSLGKIGLIRFMQQASEDDVIYANELLARYRQEIEEKAMLYMMYSSDAQDEVDDVSQAKEVLSKFTLKK
jgi:hypothetical protein